MRLKISILSKSVRARGAGRVAIPSVGKIYKNQPFSDKNPSKVGQILVSNGFLSGSHLDLLSCTLMILSPFVGELPAEHDRKW